MKVNAKKIAIAMATACVDPKYTAQKAGVSYPVILRALTGQELKLSSIGKIVRALDMDINDVLEMED